MQQPVLITFKACHFCELARWALDRSGLDYKEKWNAPFMEWAPKKPGTVFSPVPRLLTDGPTVQWPVPIVRWVDEHVAPADRQFPDEPGVKEEVNEWVELCNKDLGPPARNAIFDLTLCDRELLMEYVKHGGGNRLVARWVGFISPILGPFARKKMRLTPASLDQAMAKMDRVFNRVNDRLADGRRYLVGDRFTAADMTFASYASTMLAPPHCPAPLPPWSLLTKRVRCAFERYRRTPAGKYVFRLYEEERLLKKPPARSAAVAPRASVPAAAEARLSA